MKKSSFLDELEKDRESSKFTKIYSEITNNIVDSCVSNIKSLNKLGKTEYTFEIPYILVGYPLYDISEVSLSVNKYLKKKGLKTIFIEPNKIYITW